MRPISFFILLLPLIGEAQNTLLFELSKKGEEQKSFLFGTLHMQDEIAFSFNDSVFWAINQCETAAFELDFKKIEANNYRSYLTKFDTEEFRNDVTNYIATDFAPMLMKNFSANELSELIITDIIPNYAEFIETRLSGDKRALIVDNYLQTYAYTKSKTVVGLETFDEQMNAIIGNIDNLNLEEVGQLVLSSLKDKNLNINILKALTGSKELLDLYSQLDIDNLCATINNYEKSSNSLSQKIYNRIFFERNQVLFDRSIKLVKNGSVFIAVGAGHLCGDNGLLAQYRHAGYKIRPINLQNEYKQHVEWVNNAGDGFTVDLPMGAELSYVNPSYIQSPDIEYSFLGEGVAIFMVTEADESYDVFGTEGTESYDNEAYIGQTDAPDEEMAIDVEAIAIEEAPLSIYDIKQDDISENPNGTDRIMAIEIGDAAFQKAKEEFAEEIEEENEIYIEDFDETMAVQQEPSNTESDESASEQIETKPDRATLTEEQRAYFENIEASVKQHLRQVKTLGVMNMESLTGTSDTFNIMLNGKESLLFFNSNFMTTSLTTTITTNEKSYQLAVYGDPIALKSEEVRRFFTSFKVN